MPCVIWRVKPKAGGERTHRYSGFAIFYLWLISDVFVTLSVVLLGFYKANMASYDRLDFYKKNRDYSSLNEEEPNEEYGEEEEEFEEYEDEGQYQDDQEEVEVENEEEVEEEEEEEEDPEIRRECQEYLERREQLKELERQKLRKELGNLPSSSRGNGVRKLPNNNFGSFFGPSQPVVARRIIEENRARQEASHLAKKTFKSSKQPNSANVDSTVKDKEPIRRKVPVDTAKLKAQKLKEIRDYSFLFSEGADSSNADNKPSTSSAQNGGNSRERQVNGKSGVTAKSRPLVNKQNCKTQPSIKKPYSAVVPNKQASNGVAGHRPVQNGTLKNGLKKNVLGLKNGIKGTNSLSNGLSKDRNAQVLKISGCPSKGLSQNGISSDQKRPSLISNGNIKSAQRSNTNILTKTQMNKSVPRPPSKIIAREPSKIPGKQQGKPISQKVIAERLKKRAWEDDETEDYRSEIRKIMKYDPRRYRDDDDDDAAMEVGFSAIQAEEKRSARIAREEDEREAALIEAEERAERERLLKKRKIMKK